MLKGWRTLLAGMGLAALGVVQTYFQHGGEGLIPNDYVGPLLVAVGFVMAYLRTITNTQIFTSGK